MIYYLGKIAEGRGETATAISYYQRVIDEYPESSQAANAKNSIDTLNASVASAQEQTQAQTNE